jgi:hypothetical protein
MQRVTIVRYKVKPESVAENEALSRAVFDRVRRDQPQGVSYGLFREADGQSFIHVFVNVLEDNSDAVTGLPEFDAFQADISARCLIAPQVTREAASLVDSYGFPTT